MKKILFFLVLISIFITSAQASRTYKNRKNAKVNYAIYKVKRGDTLSVIAKRFNTTTRNLLSINKLHKTSLRVGQSLVVPYKNRNKKSYSSRGKKYSKSSKKSKEKFIKYKVDKGDTIAYIARRFHITKKEVAVINDLDMYKLPKAGKILTIPNYRYWSSRRERLRDLKLNSYSKRPTTHTVKSGDTLFSIARKYKTPIKDLAKVNGLKSTEVLRVGQKLKIPKKSYSQIAQEGTSSKKIETKKIPQKSIYYSVKKGDSLIKIAKEQKISVKELMALNDLNSKSTLRVGKKLLIKKGRDSKTDTKSIAKKEKKASAKKYVVKSGDTLWGIAKKHKISVKELKEFNNLKEKDKILDGMVLVIGYEKSKTVIAKKVKTTKKSKSKKVAKNSSKKSKKTKVALKKNRKRYSSNRSSRVSVNKIIKTAKRYLGTRYVWGAESPRGFDCSGFTQYVMRKSKGVVIPRVSRRQAYYGKYIKRKDLRPGDLIFFDTSRRRRGYVNHVGIYIGNNKFIHASSAKHRVVITSLNKPFYRARFKWGRRIN